MSDYSAPRPRPRLTPARSSSRPEATSASFAPPSRAMPTLSSPTSRTPSRPARRAQRARARSPSCGRRVVRVNGAETEWFADDLALVEALRAGRSRAAEGDTRGGRSARAVRARRSSRSSRRRRVCAPHTRPLRAPRVAALLARRRRPRRRARARAAAGRARAPLRALAGRGRLGRGRDPAAVRRRAPRLRATRPGSRRNAASHGRSAFAARRASTRRRSRSSTASSPRRRRSSTWARQVVEAYERELGEGRGAFALNGTMVDLPVVERARRILAEAERSEAR